jgi:hypothetical protein
VNGDSDLLAAFEAAILAPMRAQQMPILPGGPRFDAPATGAALLRPAGDDAAGACLTPQGLIALVNVETDRTWKALQLARSPADPDLIVQFPGDDAGDGTRRIAARLATALMRDPLFLVVTRRERAAVDPTYTIGTFEARLAIDAFKPDLAPAAQGEPLGTILIFKFHPLPLADLVADSGVWSERAAFTNDEDLAAVQTMVADAVGSKDPAFDHFRTIVLDPAWNGILALSCTLGLEGLPLELTGLLGGMDRELRVHHIGIDINRVSSEPVSLTDSSVFGLIRYPAPEAPAPLWTRDPEPVPAYDYVVDEMTVVFRNSSLVNFDARVTVTINELFGRAVQLVGRETNELVIEGSYQKQAGSTAFLFVAKDPAPFSFPVGTDELRLLRNFWGGAAEFTTVSAQDQHVEARFAFAGQLEFRADMLPFDAFGYSDPERALPLTGVGLDVAFDLVDRVPANRTIRFDASRVAVDPSATQPAGNSLPGSFPLTLRRLIAAAGDGALTASELGGQIVQVVDFTRANLATPSPKYALDFLLPLGTLGALSSVHVSFDAHLIVGWGPHPTIAARDAISIAVQLPGVTPGFRGMELQGILKTSFATANMGRFPYAESANRAAGHAYLLSFNDVGLRLFGFKLPPGYVVDALMFAGEGDPSLSNLGWYLGVKPQEDEPLLVGAGTSAAP